jgi:outer membrane protein OmpA-like peptidoglycan-associated protein
VHFDVSYNEYDGDLGNQFFEFGSGSGSTFGTTVGADFYLNNSFDALYSLSIGELDAEKQVGENLEFFNNTFIRNAVMARYKFSNGYLLSEDSPVQPFIASGIALTSYTGGERDIKGRGVTSDVRDGRVITIPIAIGIDVPVRDNIHLYAKWKYNRTFAEGYDGRDKLDGKDHDDYLMHSVGVKIALSKSGSKSSDLNRFPDYDDPDPPQTEEKTDETEEPKEKETIENEKKPVEIADTDGDGFNDEEDSCPQLAGVDYLKGCPDADGDKLGDAEDECPKIAGDARLGGCPDDDSDGIINSADECISEPGIKELNGCPVKEDRDNDDIIDEEDACPNEAGIRKLNGCPPRDSDEDGVTDDRDECPNEAGVAEINGCPKEKEETEAADEEEGPVKGVGEDLKKIVDEIYNNLSYQPGKALIDDSSKDDLDRLAQIMEDDPKLQLIIEGYTDNAGKASYNLLLSRDRADAVKQYLMGKGIAEGRLRAEGYGEILPLAPNETEAGRAKNRRVEMRLTYF